MDILQIPETFPINAHGTRVIIFHKKKRLFEVFFQDTY
jgi:hypothetical protein